MPARSTRMMRCSRAPSAARNTRRRREFRLVALAIGDRQRIALEALRRAQASAVAESRPPESSTTARAPISARAHCPRDTCAAGSGSAPAGGPRESSRPACGREVARGSARTAPDSARPAAATLELAAAPLVVGAIAQHELDLLLRPQQRQLLVAVALLLARAGRLDVHDADDARIHLLRSPSRRWSRARRGSPASASALSSARQLGCASGSPAGDAHVARAVARRTRSRIAGSSHHAPP